MGFELLQITNSQVQSTYRQWQAAVRAGDQERARELATELARRLTIAPMNHRFWRTGDLRRILILYGLALGVIGHHALTGGGLLAAIWGNRNPLMTALLLVNFLPLLYTSLISWLTREQAQGTAFFLRLTRLSGHDLLYAAYTAYVLGGMVRIYLIYIAPLLLLLATAGYQSFGTGFWFVGRYGLCLIAFGVQWQTLLAFLTLARPTLLMQALVQAFIVLVILAFVFLPAAAAQNLPRAALEWFETSPIWLWGVQPLFWWSVLFPPLAASIGVEITHPLWGVPQAVLALALAWLLAPLAARRLQRMLHAPEPEIKVQEGGWW
ncbi:MAG: hypothetical protein ACK4RG_05040 [Fimbriimonadales bacterium]